MASTRRVTTVTTFQPRNASMPSVPFAVLAVAVPLDDSFNEVRRAVQRLPLLCCQRSDCMDRFVEDIGEHMFANGDSQ